MTEEKMKIGIDIDDVLVETAPTIVSFINKKEGTDFKIEDSKEFGLWTLLNCSQEESIKRVYDFFYSDIFENLTPLEGAIEGVNFLSDNFDLFAITSRDDKFGAQTISWFNNFFKNNFKDILFTNQLSGEGIVKSKCQICKELGISILIEDRRKYALECAQNGIKVLLMDKPWNRENCEHENIIRVKDWNEIMERIGGIKNAD